MGRTLPSITQAFLQEQESFNRFRRALRRSDQLALDDLFASAQKHLAAAAYAAHALPMEIFLLAMLLEEHKLNLQLHHRLEALSPAQSWPLPEDGQPLQGGLEPAGGLESPGEASLLENFTLPGGLKPSRAIQSQVGAGKPDPHR